MPPIDAASTDRRTFLKFIGAGALAAGDLLGPLARAAAAGPRPTIERPFVAADGTPLFEPVRVPLPMPGDPGGPADDARRLATFEVRDDLVLPPGYRAEVLVGWGDRLGPPGEEVVFGFNADYTGLVPMPGRPGDFWLIVNHEYISARSWMPGAAEARGEPVPEIRLEPGPNGARMLVDGRPAPSAELDVTELRAAAMDDPTSDAAALLRSIESVCEAAMDDLGVTVLHVRQRADGGFEVVRDSGHHLRISGAHPETPTFGNCSGATTPWGTFLTCEENFQDHVQEFIDAAGRPKPGVTLPFAAVGVSDRSPHPFEFQGLAEGRRSSPDGRDFGWVGEVDPRAKSLRKLERLGRFRHENVALRAEPGSRLAAYMGDDRRGGHVWKFISDGVVVDPADPATARLLDAGTLCAARFEADFRGAWIPLEPGTPLRRPRPERSATGHVWLPDRRSVDPATGVPTGGHVAVGAAGSSRGEMTADEWIQSIEQRVGRPFDECTLGSLVWDPPGETLTGERRRRHERRVIALDAYAMAVAAGATPTARPEDVEVHPIDASVYVAFTDSTGSGDGGPDVEVFPDSAGTNSRQYGAIYRLREDDDDPSATTFSWGRFVSSGEVAEGGGGFACADNLMFDPDGNLWMVCDITTSSHNFEVDRSRDDGRPGSGGFRGVFGNNALYVIPTRGPLAGVPKCFAIGPMECELTGPTLSPDGRCLILAVQHPGEAFGMRTEDERGDLASEIRTLEIADRAGGLFQQRRTVPLGSRFAADPRWTWAGPRPCVVCITRDGVG